MALEAHVFSKRCAFGILVFVSAYTFCMQNYSKLTESDKEYLEKLKGWIDCHWQESVKIAEVTHVHVRTSEDFISKREFALSFRYNIQRPINTRFTKN
jgi:hypothetical protein